MISLTKAISEEQRKQLGLQRAHNMFSIQGNGTILWLPNPDKSSADGLIATLVNSGRNASGVVTAQKIGRDQDKTNLKWNYLEKDIWEQMIKFWDKNFYFQFTYYSPLFSKKITREFYVSDRSYKPFDIDVNGNPTAYIDCSANVVDTGR